MSVTLFVYASFNKALSWWRHKATKNVGYKKVQDCRHMSKEMQTGGKPWWIWSNHSGDYRECGLLGYSAM
jgi:hypothetical protein